MGLGDLYPDRMTDSVYGLDWEKLAGRYRGVIFDIDNTLVPHGAPADEKAIRLTGYTVWAFAPCWYQIMEKKG